MKTRTLIAVTAGLITAGILLTRSSHAASDDTGAIALIGQIGNQPALQNVNWYELTSKDKYSLLVQQHQAVIRKQPGTYTICGTLSPEPKNLICASRTVEANRSTKPIVIDFK